MSTPNNLTPNNNLIEEDFTEDDQDGRWDVVRDNNRIVEDDGEDDEDDAPVVVKQLRWYPLQFFTRHEGGNTTWNNVADTDMMLSMTADGLYDHFRTSAEKARAFTKEDCPMFSPVDYVLSDYEQAMQKVWVHGKKQMVGKTGYFGEPLIKRCGDNIQRVTMLMADYDDGLSVADAETMFADYSYILYTSYNHGKIGEDGKPIDKFRMVFEVKRPVSMEQFKARRDDIRKFLGPVDKSSTDMSRGFFIPCRNMTGWKMGADGEVIRDGADGVMVDGLPGTPAVVKRHQGKSIDLMDFEAVRSRAKTSKAARVAMNANRTFLSDHACAETVLMHVANMTLGERGLWRATVAALKAENYSLGQIETACADNPNHISAGTGIKTVDMVESEFEEKYSDDYDTGVPVLYRYLKDFGDADGRGFRIPSECWPNDTVESLSEKLEEYEQQLKLNTKRWERAEGSNKDKFEAEAVDININIDRVLARLDALESKV